VIGGGIFLKKTVFANPAASGLAHPVPSSQDPPKPPMIPDSLAPPIIASTALGVPDGTAMFNFSIYTTDEALGISCVVCLQAAWINNEGKMATNGPVLLVSPSSPENLTKPLKAYCQVGNKWMATATPVSGKTWLDVTNRRDANQRLVDVNFTISKQD
jgi:hypothetical protein